MGGHDGPASKMTTCEARSERPHASADEVGRDGVARNRIPSDTRGRPLRGVPER